MAMIKCPECEKEISDKAKECIHCGCPIRQNEPQKVEVIKKKRKMTKKKKITIIISTIVIICGIIGGIIFYNEIKKNDKKIDIGLYKSQLDLASSEMLIGSISAEECGDLISDVWYNSIFKKSDSKTDKYTKKNGKFNDDFNDSLNALFEDEDFSKEIEELKDNQEEVKKSMKELQNPPEGMEDAYYDIKEFYDNYLKLTKLCIDPSGNYNSYISKLNEADDAVSTSYQKMEAYQDY